MLTPTTHPNLKLVSGSRSMLYLANLRHAAKQRLLGQLQRLDADHVLIDVSAGSAYNALDFFLAADRQILVVVPEPTSVDNAYHFLKAAFFRSLGQAVRRLPVRAAVVEVLERGARRRARSPLDLIDG